MSSYPAYIHRMLDQAREDGQWHAYQTDAAALCFDVLALLPDSAEAAAIDANITYVTSTSETTWRII